MQTITSIRIAHGGKRIHCSHGDSVCSTKSGWARKACAAEATALAQEIYPGGTESHSRGQAWIYPDADSAIAAIRAFMATAPKPRDFASLAEFQAALDEWQQS